MSQLRRKCRLSNADHSHIDLRGFEEEIINTINDTIPNKNPKVFKSYFSTDELNQSEAVAIGRALSKVEALAKFGKKIETFRLFEGKLYESEAAEIVKRRVKNKEIQGGRLK